MSEPVPDDLRVLLETERTRPDPGDARDRVASRLSAMLGPAALGGAAGGAVGSGAAAGAVAGGAAATGSAIGPAAAGTSGLVAGLLAKPVIVGLAVVTIGAGAGGLYALRGGDAAPPPMTATTS